MRDAVLRTTVKKMLNRFMSLCGQLVNVLMRALLKMLRLCSFGE